VREVSAFDAVADMRPYRIWKGAIARALHGERLTMAIVDLEPNLEVPEHHHDNEQLGFVLRGKVTMTVAGESRELGAGGTYRISSEVPHSAATGPEGATVVDVFAPVRADWEKAERMQPQPGMWP
jgi:quercetin dioxygenase-like cupin family protein